MEISWHKGFAIKLTAALNPPIRSADMRPSIESQVAERKLVCPKTRQPLILVDDHLISEDGKISYPLINGVPILLSPERSAAYLSRQDAAMAAEYNQERPGALRSVYRSLEGAVGDMRTAGSRQAFEAIFQDLPLDALCLSVGGGPVRVHPDLVNLNLGPFANVDVVADAYALPYSDGSVDAVHCEAVLEHLEFPDAAVLEMNRVLRPGGKAFAATPFLQSFHGYPDHYQNFTTTGHRRLFERAGFEIIAAGTCVGPTFALRDLAVNYIRSILPGGRIGKLGSRLFALLTLPILWLDHWANERPLSAYLASTTYLSLKKK
jgi:SAM-dependent methyltransferase